MKIILTAFAHNVEGKLDKVNNLKILPPEE
jgi:hypothetical protein